MWFSRPGSRIVHGGSAAWREIKRARRLLAMALVGLACSEANPELHPAGVRGAEGLERCDLKGTLALCGQTSVWENRELESGRRIQLHYAVLRSYSASPARDAVFFLAGGPGQSAITLAHDMAPLLESVRRERDIVFLDQRGTGQSNPLNCELADPNDPNEQFRTDFNQNKLKQCVAALDADTTQYTTAAAVADLEDVRKALGYERVNLIGASYGTRLALAYAREHSSSLRSMVLDGVAPPQLRLFLDFLPDGQRALDQAFDYCERNVDCNRSYPSLRQDFAALMARLEREPLIAKVQHPETGEELELTLTADAFASAVRGMLYSAEVSQLLPVVIEQVADGKLDALLTQAMLVSHSVQETMSLGLLLSVACAEDLPRVSDAELAEYSNQSFLPASSVTEIRKACDVWPHAIADAKAAEPVVSDVPTLLLSGELDPATPPRWADLTLDGLHQGLHLVVPGQGHGTLSVGCVPNLVSRFVRDGNTQGLDTGCVEGLKRPHFFLDLLGPRP
ncbi:MAG: alpha/beta fold hydrolase [Polyangiaceae bacterium]|nr:alpha/beta fold hydrolase [Polyangiaceae bacterium]MCB9608746.1 alpha/beta fold hydrolase [Polyangiaceae bacterium]